MSKAVPLLVTAALLIALLVFIANSKSSLPPKTKQPGAAKAFASRNPIEPQLRPLPEQERASFYFEAFDIEAQKFKALQAAGALVQGAANGGELRATLEYIVTGKILVEQPHAPAGK